MHKSERIEYFIINKCSNRCIFCSECDKFDGREKSVNEIEKVLLAQNIKGCQVVHFMGGEPTIHTDFIKILILAKKLGLLTHIISNGIKFASENFCKKALPYLDEIMISVHGQNSDLHNVHTGNPKSFRALEKGLFNLNKYCAGRLLGTTTISSLNLNSLDKIAIFFSKYSKIKEIQYISVIPSGEGGRNFIKITPRLLDLKMMIPEIVEVCERKKIDLRFSGVPMCILGEYYIFSQDLWEDFKIDNKKTHNDELLLWKEPKDFPQGENFKIDIGRIKTKKCGKCALKSICGGIYKKYYQRYGDLELAPFPWQ